MAKTLRSLNRDVDKAIRGLENMTEPIGDSLDHVEEDIERRIDRGVDIEGSKFKPLSAKYKKRKAKKFPGMPILKATRTMLSGANIRRRIGKKTGKLTYGVGKGDYAGFHQEGGGKLPRRAFGGVSDDAANKVEKIFGDWTGDVLDKSFN